MQHFEYLEPTTLEEAVSLLSKYGDKAKVLAGGTRLVAAIKRRVVRPQCVISLRQIGGLDQIRFDKQGNLEVGALATIHDIQRSPDIEGGYGAICEAAGQLASLSVRSAATVGGNLCDAAPSADMAPILIALSAAARLVSTAGERIVPLEDFFTGPGTTALKTDELLIGIRVPLPPAHTAGAYQKLRSKGVAGSAIVGVAAVITLGSRNGVCSDAKVVLGGAAPTPMRAREAEGILKGNKIDEGLITRAAQVASDESSPKSDLRSTAEYKQKMLKLIAAEAIRRAAELARATA